MCSMSPRGCWALEEALLGLPDIKPRLISLISAMFIFRLSDLQFLSVSLEDPPRNSKVTTFPFTHPFK